MTLASTLIDECESDVLDTDNDRWSTDNWLDFLNAAERQLVYLKPSSYVQTLVYQLVAGTRQSIPDGTSSYQSPAGSTHPEAIDLVDILQNMGTAGTTAGASIHKIDPKDLDEVLPDWRSDTAAATVQHFMFDPNNREEFEVYPPQPSSSMGWVKAVLSVIPTELTAVGDSINLGDEYREPLKAYMKFRAWSWDAQVSQFAYQRAMDAWNLFVTLIGRKDLVETRLPARRGSHGNTNQRVPQ